MEGRYFMGIGDGGETEVAGGAVEQIEVFVLLFLCRKDLEHGSGGGGGEDCGGRTAVKCSRRWRREKLESVGKTEKQG